MRSATATDMPIRVEAIVEFIALKNVEEGAAHCCIDISCRLRVAMID